MAGGIVARLSMGRLARSADLLALPRRTASEQLNHTDREPSQSETDDRDRRRFISARLIQVHHVRSERENPRQDKIADGEFAHHNREGEKCAAQERNPQVWKDDAKNNGEPIGAERLRGFGQSTDINCAQAGIDHPEHVW